MRRLADGNTLEWARCNAITVLKQYSQVQSGLWGKREQARVMHAAQGKRVRTRRAGEGLQCAAARAVGRNWRRWLHVGAVTADGAVCAT